MPNAQVSIGLGVTLGLLIVGILLYVIWRNREKLIYLYGLYFHKSRTGQTQPDYENCFQDPNTKNSYKNASVSSESLKGVYTLAKITNNNPSFYRNDSRRMKQDDTAILITGAEDDGSSNVDHIYTEPNAAATISFEEDDLEVTDAPPTYDEPEVDAQGTDKIVVRNVTPTYSLQIAIGQTSSEVYHELEPCVEHGAHSGRIPTTQINNAAERGNSSLKARKTNRPSTKQLTMYSSLGRLPKISSGNEYNAPQREERLDEYYAQDTL